MKVAELPKYFGVGAFLAPRGEGFAFGAWKRYAKRCPVESCRVCARLWAKGFR